MLGSFAKKRTVDNIVISTDWVIVGAMTGTHANKHRPQREWIKRIVEYCRVGDMPVFLKNNLADIWGEPLIQEFPWAP
jgi:protein gp37